MERCVRITPNSLALVLSRAGREEAREDPASSSPAKPQHHSGYEVFASFKAANMRHFWNKALVHALAEVFFLGWMEEQVLLVRGREAHLQVLRNGWTRRTLEPPRGFDIKCVGE